MTDTVSFALPPPSTFTGRSLIWFLGKRTPSGAGRDPGVGGAPRNVAPLVLGTYNLVRGG